MEVDWQLGPGGFRAAYEAALAIRRETVQGGFRLQVSFPVLSRGKTIGEYRVDLLGEEIKSVERLAPVSEDQVLTDLSAGLFRLGASVSD